MLDSNHVFYSGPFSLNPLILILIVAWPKLHAVCRGHAAILLSIVIMLLDPQLMKIYVFGFTPMSVFGWFVVKFEPCSLVKPYRLLPRGHMIDLYYPEVDMVDGC